jgi:DNA invertase Pin-like site-specific DNA recombinase
VACDLREANELVVHILAAVAQAERKAMSERTKAALAAARARGIRPGNPRLKPGSAASADFARRSRSESVKRRAAELGEVIADAEQRGCNTPRNLADHLNQLGVTTPQGRRWDANSVRRVRHRIATEVIA